MKHLKLFENFELMINEDILELKQISKEVYSALKKEGLLPKLVTQVDWESAPKTKIGAGEKGGIPSTKAKLDDGRFSDGTLVQVVEDTETCLVGLPFVTVGRLLGFTEQKNGVLEGWWKSPELKERAMEIGKKILDTVKNKYPNSVFLFDGLRDNYWFVMRFGLSAKTRKGGDKNPNQRPNVPKK